MSQSEASGTGTAEAVAKLVERRELSEAAKRALAEAEARRAERDRQTEERAKEIGGAAGPDPVRYGDWEKDGIVSDF